MTEGLYTVDFSEPSGFLEIGEYKIPLPKMPEEKYMLNFEKKSKDQFFQPTIFPDSLKKMKPTNEAEGRWIMDEYHKRDNGVWMLINGSPYYLPGGYYHFLNYWTTQRGSKPYFYLPQRDLNILLDYIDNDPNSYGLNLIKARRMRATELSIHRHYNYATRYRSVKCGMQSKDERTVYSNYRRILRGHDGMAWWMKPINLGSSMNKEGLFFQYPAELITNKRLTDLADAGGIQKEQIFLEEQLFSEITYGPCRSLFYDGDVMDRYALNEACKLMGMSLLEVIEVIKQCMSESNGTIITGKGLAESTVESLSDEQLEEVIEFWRNSDPANRDANGRTLSGFDRLFMSAIDASEPDEYGMPKKKEAEIFLKNQFDALNKAGKQKQLTSLKRKLPLVIEDALTPSGDQCAFNKENLQEALSYIDFPLKGKEKPTVVGNLMWEQGNFSGRVIFEPNPEGRWEFSMLAGPNTYPDNAIGYYGAERIPNNVNKIRIGIDPYDHKEVVDNRKSKGGAVGGIMYDDLKDGARMGDDGKPFELAKDWETHQPIFTYYYRQPDPQDFFEDMLMSAVYCGAPVLFENNKQSIRNHFVNRGYSNFIMKRPEGTMSAAQRQGVLTDGIPASENTIQQYYDALDTFISRNANSIKHRNLIVDLLAMNRQNHGKHDLGVAFGWLLIAMTKKYAEVKPQEAEPEPWFEEYMV